MCVTMNFHTLSNPEILGKANFNAPVSDKLVETKFTKAHLYM